MILHNLKAAVINRLSANKRYPMQIRAACLVLRWVRVCGISFGPGCNFPKFFFNEQPKNMKLFKTRQSLFATCSKYLYEELITVLIIDKFLRQNFETKKIFITILHVPERLFTLLTHGRGTTLPWSVGYGTETLATTRTPLICGVRERERTRTIVNVQRGLLFLKFFFSDRQAADRLLADRICR